MWLSKAVAGNGEVDVDDTTQIEWPYLTHRMQMGVEVTTINVRKHQPNAVNMHHLARFHFRDALDNTRIDEISLHHNQLPHVQKTAKPRHPFYLPGPQGQETNTNISINIA